MAEQENDEYSSELGDLKENVKNLGDCLNKVLRRIEELETKRGEKNCTSNATDMNLLLNAVPSPDSSDKKVNVETSQFKSDDGSKVTKRIVTTERVVTTKSFGQPLQLGSPLYEFVPPPYHEQESWIMTDSTPVAPQPCVVGYRRKKADNHLVSTAYSARLTIVRCCDPDKDALLLQGLTTRQRDGQLIVETLNDQSPLAKQGLIHSGDSILEVNGKEVKTQEQLENEIKNAPSDGISLKVVPVNMDPPLRDGTYIKTHFDYDSSSDTQIPCKEIGLSFKAGDVLQVVSKDDPSWWQARKVNDMSRIGLIPSQSLQAGRKSSTSATDNESKQTSKRRKIQLPSSGRGSVMSSEPLIYEEVAKLSPYGRRVLILIGAAGVGRRTLKTMLLQNDRNNFATVTPYTSRTKREIEQEGREYHFVKRDRMQKDIDGGLYVEWGGYNNNLYGTTVQSVTQIVKSGRMCVLDCSPQALRHLYSKEYMPYIVFVAPPSLDELRQLYQVHPNRTKTKTEEDLKRTCEESVKLETQYKHLFDLVLVNRNVDVTFRRLLDALENLKIDTQWVPAGWL